MVIVRDDHTQCRVRRSAQIKELIFSKDGLIQSVKIQLPNRNIISRAINHLYPLEITSEVSNDRETPCDDNLVKERTVSNRKAAIAARNKISKQITKTTTCLIFCSPQSVMDSNT